MVAALIFWTVLGGLAGAFAKSVFWFESSDGWLLCILFGVAGGIGGGYLAGSTRAFDLSGMGFILVGAAAVLSGYSLLARRARTRVEERRRAA